MQSCKNLVMVSFLVVSVKHHWNIHSWKIQTAITFERNEKYEKKPQDSTKNVLFQKEQSIAWPPIFYVNNKAMASLLHKLRIAGAGDIREPGWKMQNPARKTADNRIAP